MGELTTKNNNAADIAARALRDRSICINASIFTDNILLKRISLEVNIE